MVTHPDINPVQQGLISVNRREPVLPFGDSRTRPYGVMLNPTEKELYYLITL